MKILFITRKFPPSKGGMELFAHDLSRALRTKTRLTLVKWGGSNKALPVVLPWLAVCGFWALLRRKGDVIHMQDTVLAPIGLVLSRLFRKPFVVVVHGLDVTYDNLIYRWVNLPALRRADKVVCISQAAAEQAMKRGVAADQIQIIPLAVDDVLHGRAPRSALRDYLGIAQATPVLMTVGRLVKRKGVAWFISDVLPNLVKHFPEVVYIVVGEGDERGPIESAIEAQGLQAHVRLLGRVEPEVLAAAYNGADIFVMPNINVPDDIEGFGLVLLEASVSGLPVVAANTEGIKDAVTDGKNGVLVPVGDASAYRRELSRFLQDPARAKRFGAASRAFSLSTYQWGPISDRYLELYKSLRSR